MSLEQLKNALPEFAKDIKLNLSTLSGDDSLSQQQLWGTFLACAMATRQDDVMSTLGAEAATHLSAEAQTAAKAAATIMAMNNVYYRSVHIMSNKEYHGMPAKLRMNVIGAPGVDKTDFELWSFAVSAIGGCGMCLDAHEAQLKQHGFTTAQIQTALRIASVVNAAATAIAIAGCENPMLAQAA